MRHAETPDLSERHPPRIGDGSSLFVGAGIGHSVGFGKIYGLDPVNESSAAVLHPDRVFYAYGHSIEIDQAVRAAGLEPARPFGQGVLSALCLPVPSRPRASEPITVIAPRHRQAIAPP